MTESAQKTNNSQAPGALGLQSSSQAGMFYGITAYTMWGVFPLYFRALAHVPPLVVVCHRILWSVLFIGALVAFRKDWRHIASVLRSRRNVLFLSAGAVLLALNWLIFIYAVGSRQVLQASLGYFINPLFSVALGMIFLRERLRGWQWIAVLVALVAVANLAFRGAGFPWIAVSLAVTFGLYGLVRKKVDVNSLHALLVESSILLPLSVLLLAVLPNAKTSLGTFGILSMSGVITAVPLLFFGAALRRLKLSTMGFLQYIGPTLQFLVAIWIVGEPLDRAKLASFSLCWVAIAIYILDSLVNRRVRPVADEPE